MKLKQTINLFLILPLAFALASCGSSSSDKNKNSDEFKKAEESLLKKEIADVLYNIPSPSEIPYLLQSTGAEFNQTLVNSPAKASQYATHADKAALNLGVYAADIGYLSSYDKTQEAINYLSACKALADKLNIIGAFDVDMAKKFEANISNKDSLSRMLDHAIQTSEAFLKDDSRNKLSSLVITGSFIEGLYISTGLVRSFPKNLLPGDSRNIVLTPLIRVVLEQKKSVSEILKLLGSVEQSDPITSISADFKKLNDYYAALNIEEQIKNNKADLILSDKNLEEITKIIDKLRKSVTN